MDQKWEAQHIDQFINALEKRNAEILIRYFEQSAFNLLEECDDLSQNDILYLIENENFSPFQEPLCTLFFKKYYKILESIITNPTYEFKKKIVIVERGLVFDFLAILPLYFTQASDLYPAFKIFFAKHYEKILNIINNPDFTPYLDSIWVPIYLADAIENQNKPVFERWGIPKFSNFNKEDQWVIVKFLLKQKNFDFRMHSDDFLMETVAADQVELLKYILSFEAILNSLELDYSPIKRAIQLNNVILLKCFIECKALQSTPIHFEVIFEYARNYERIECLFAFLQDPFYKNAFLTMGLDKILNYPEKIIQYIGNDQSLANVWTENEKNFKAAIQCNLSQVVKLSLSPSLSFNRYNLLLIACQNECKDIVKLLLDENNSTLDAILKCRTREDRKKTQDLWLASKEHISVISLLYTHRKMQQSKGLNHPTILLGDLFEGDYSVQEYLFNFYEESLDIQTRIQYAIEFCKSSKIENLVKEANYITAENFGEILANEYTNKGRVKLAKRILSLPINFSYTIRERIEILFDALVSKEGLKLVLNHQALRLSNIEFTLFLDTVLFSLYNQLKDFIYNFLEEIIFKALKEENKNQYFRQVVISLVNNYEEYVALICKVNHIGLAEYIVNCAEIIQYSSKSEFSWISKFLTYAAKFSPEIILVIINSLVKLNNNHYVLLLKNLIEYTDYENTLKVLETSFFDNVINNENFNSFLSLCINSEVDSSDKFIKVLGLGYPKIIPDGVMLLGVAVQSSNIKIIEWIMRNKIFFNWINFFLFTQSRTFIEPNYVSCNYEIIFDRNLLSCNFNTKLIYTQCLQDPEVISQLENHSELKEYRENIIEAIYTAHDMLIRDSILKYGYISSSNDNRFYLCRNIVFNIGEIKRLTENICSEGKNQIFSLLECFSDDIDQDDESSLFILFFELYLYCYTNRPISSLKTLFNKAGFTYSLNEDIKNIAFPMSEKDTQLLIGLLWQDAFFRAYIKEDELTVWINETFSEMNGEGLIRMITQIQAPTVMPQVSSVSAAGSRR